MSNALRYAGHWTLKPRDEYALRTFLERVSEFREFGLFGYPVEATIGIKDGEAFAEATLPDERALRLSAQVARHFHLKKEATQIRRVCNLLYQAAHDQSFKDEVERIRARHKTLLRDPLNPTTGDPAITTREDLLDAYFHGHYFHADPDKRAFVEKNDEGWGPLHKQAFAQTLIGLYQVARALARVVENALGHDQLAPCAVSKRVQTLLAQRGLGPAPITIAQSLDGSTDPPTSGIRCEIDLRISDRDLDQILGPALALLQEARPEYPIHSVAWLTEEGEYHFVELPPRETAPE